MASIITKIRLINFRRFRDYTVTPNERINILVGDNEVGKVVSSRLLIWLLAEMCAEWNRLV